MAKKHPSRRSKRSKKSRNLSSNNGRRTNQIPRSSTNGQVRRPNSTDHRQRKAGASHAHGPEQVAASGFFKSQFFKENGYSKIGQRDPDGHALLSKRAQRALRKSGNIQNFSSNPVRYTSKSISRAKKSTSSKRTKSGRVEKKRPHADFDHSHARHRREMPMLYSSEAPSSPVTCSPNTAKQRVKSFHLLKKAEEFDESEEESEGSPSEVASEDGSDSS